MESSSNGNNYSDEIDISNIIDQARKFHQAGDYQLSEIYANLAIIGAESDESLKISALGIKSYICNRNKNISTVIHIARKILKRIKFCYSIPEKLEYTFIRILYRCAKFLYENKEFFLSSYFFYKVKNYINKNKTDNDTKEQIENDFNLSLNHISTILSGKKI